MAKNTPFKNLSKKVQPEQETSKKSADLVINQWMAGNNLQNDQDVIVYPQTLEQDKPQPQESIINTKNPRIETGLLKVRIAEKIKKFGKTS